jgi:folylpolyglutamate synthase/dihydrofolate synthase
MRRLLDALSHPEQAYPAVVVAGSVGKGTTCHQIASLMNTHLKVGLYTSPHLHIFRERFVINGQMIAQAELIEGVQAVQQAAANLDTHYSTFEQATALAVWWFRQQAVDIAVLEIGIGGRCDKARWVHLVHLQSTRILSSRGVLILFQGWHAMHIFVTHLQVRMPNAYTFLYVAGSPFVPLLYF